MPPGETNTAWAPRIPARLCQNFPAAAAAAADTGKERNAMDQVTPLVEIAAGTVPLIVSLLIHGVGMFLVQRAFRTRGVRVFTSGRHEQLFLAGMIVVLLTTHLVEMLVWAVALVLIQAVTEFRDAFYYVAGTYTTLGYGEGTLPKSWRLLAPMIAISGLFAFGWTTGVLLNLMSQAAVLNAARDIAASAKTDRPPKS